MEFILQVRVEVERVSGKFASRDEIEEKLISVLEQADPGSIGGVGADGDSEYEVSIWEVEQAK